MLEWRPTSLRLSDGYEAFARLWQPERPRGAVLYLHGIQSHGGWFEGSAAKLAEAGWAVLLPDRRGSGRNAVNRGHTPWARRLLLDCVEWLDDLKRQTGAERAHIVGVSWGGKLALALHRFAPARVASLALVAPGLFPRVDLPLRDKVLVGLTLLAAPKTRFDIPLNEPELFTANPARQQFIREDPLRLMQVTTRFLFASRRLDRYALSPRAFLRPAPLHLFLAEHDAIIESPRTRDFVRRLQWPGRKITEYPGAHHTLEFEADPQTYISDLISWLDGLPR
jgi:acylglycerol lipase